MRKNYPLVIKKRLPYLIFLLVFQIGISQEVALRKGVIIDSVQVDDENNETFSLYLPTNFVTSKKWPVLYVFDMDGKGLQAMSMFKQAAEAKGYILASPDNINDTLSLSENMLRVGRAIDGVSRLLPIQNERLYVAGFAYGARFANITPLFLNKIRGVISCGASFMNLELLNSKRRFHFIGIVGNKDFNYIELLKLKKVLNGLKHPNQLLVFEGGHKWPDSQHFEKALTLFDLAEMAKGNIPQDSLIVNESYRQDLERFQELRSGSKLLLAEQVLDRMLAVYRPHREVDSLKKLKKELRKDKLYRALKRQENAARFKESLLKEDYVYYIEEDILTYNYNNLGWWNYQMTEINKFIYQGNAAEKRMGHRLQGFINALVEDNIFIINAENQPDEEALLFLYMLKTITDPTDYDYYLKVISLSAKKEDFGTAIFYLEEVLKRGYKDKERLYSLDHTALLRITPEYNKVIEKYLDDARYEIIDE
ncbi:alpha/beta hydrolase [Flagellimonas lutaonensis]|uniref:Conserved hypothetical lipoprotein n=1 Tax=Flagellimonas lutaonensis TaxID=516051 RepID=A0A0D5YPN4_9FLAO|nr:alpha/beta hydrolase [Allomuricauda lutaonensis]AKA34182.1 Conserved hypothetical lipoprotein [Allomuricauda lutaonensis]